MDARLDGKVTCAARAALYPLIRDHVLREAVAS
jgi:hypothetical protein